MAATRCTRLRRVCDRRRLLASLRVLDLSGDDGDAVTRLLADLGADVLKVEPPGGSPSRTRPPDAGRHQPALRAAQRQQAQHGARPVRPGRPNPVDRTRRQRRHRRRQRQSRSGRRVRNLVRRLGRSLSSSWWHCRSPTSAECGPRSSWRATDPVLYALSGALARSGPTTGTPVSPPDGIASATAAVQAAWAALAAYYNRLRCGTGDYIDFSRFDAVVMALDPAFGRTGRPLRVSADLIGGADDRETRTPTRSTPARTATYGSA